MKYALAILWLASSASAQVLPYDVKDTAIMENLNYLAQQNAVAGDIKAAGDNTFTGTNTDQGPRVQNSSFAANGLSTFASLPIGAISLSTVGLAGVGTTDTSCQVGVTGSTITAIGSKFLIGFQGSYAPGGGGISKTGFLADSTYPPGAQGGPGDFTASRLEGVQVGSDSTGRDASFTSVWFAAAYGTHTFTMLACDNVGNGTLGPTGNGGTRATFFVLGAR